MQIDKLAQDNRHQPGLSWAKLMYGYPTEHHLWAKHLGVSLPLDFLKIRGTVVQLVVVTIPNSWCLSIRQATNSHETAENE